MTPDEQRICDQAADVIQRLTKDFMVFRFARAKLDRDAIGIAPLTDRQRQALRRTVVDAASRIVTAGRTDAILVIRKAQARRHPEVSYGMQ